MNIRNKLKIVKLADIKPYAKNAKKHTPGQIEALKKYNRWTILSESKKGYRYYLCKCDCGTIRDVMKYNLYDGNSASCGCLNKELFEKNVKGKRKTHGESKTRFYKIWKGIVKRGNTSDIKRYENIGISKEWLKYENFKRDMFYSYCKHLSEHGEKNTTIDRIDNNSGYSLNNCEWKTKKQQALNRRSNIFLTYSGVTKTAAEWADELNIPRHLIYNRYHYGWSDSDILTKNVKKQ